jgi:hypothetical protein
MRTNFKQQVLLYIGRTQAEDILNEEKPDETGDSMETFPRELLFLLAEQMPVSAL